MSQNAMLAVPAGRALTADVALMQQMQAGARPQFAELYRRFAPRAFRTAWFVCHDPDCAQDAVQDAFISIWSSRATYQPARGSVEQWVMAIVRHRAIYLARRRSVSEPVIEEAAHLGEHLGRDDASADLVARTDAEQLARLMGRLPAAQREVIRLGFFDGLTHQQIALRLGIPPGTVKGRMRLGLAKLRSGFSA